MNLLDASAVLAFLQGEEGADAVRKALEEGASCASVNWSEVAQKVASHGRDWTLARALLAGYGLDVLPVDLEEAELAARLWRPGSSLSLADRLCLAAGELRDATVWTADNAWGSDGRIEQIR